MQNILSARLSILSVVASPVSCMGPANRSGLYGLQSTFFGIGRGYLSPPDDGEPHHQVALGPRLGRILCATLFALCPQAVQMLTLLFTSNPFACKVALSIFSLVCTFMHLMCLMKAAWRVLMDVSTATAVPAGVQAPPSPCRVDPPGYLDFMVHHRCYLMLPLSPCLSTAAACCLVCLLLAFATCRCHLVVPTRSKRG